MISVIKLCLIDVEVVIWVDFPTVIEMRESGLVLVDENVLYLFTLMYYVVVDFAHILTTQLWVIYFCHFQKTLLPFNFLNFFITYRIQFLLGLGLLLGLIKNVDI